MKLFSAILFSLLTGITLFLYAAYRWVFTTFGDCSMDQILMHLFIPIKTVPETMVTSLIWRVLGIVAVMLFVFFFFWKGTDCILNKEFWVKVFKLCISLFQKIFLFVRKHLRFISTVGYAVFLIVILLMIHTRLNRHFMFDSYVKGLFQTTNWFRDNYVFADIEKITFSQKRNVVLIISESLENTYSDSEERLFCENLLPRLSALQKENVSFSRHRSLNGTAWTIAALTSYFYGVPRLKIYGNDYANSSIYPIFYTPSLWDVFLKNGYACEYVQGGTMEFAAKNQLFALLPEVKIRSFETYCKDPDYLALPGKPIFGVQDEIIFSDCRTQTTELYQTGKPFFLALLTMDTHHPNGFLSPRKKLHHENQMKNVILEQDRMIAEYIDWLKKQPFAKDTVIIVVGDHLSMRNTLYDEYLLRAKDRFVFNCVLFPDGKQFASDREHGTFDWAPTILEAAGAKIPNSRFGVGVSLFSTQQNMIEKNGLDWYAQEIQKANSGYKSLFDKKKIR